jgi:hypothetical protein
VAPGPHEVAAPFYSPEAIEWVPRGQQPARAILPRARTDTTVFLHPPAAAAYDPSDLAWQVRAQQPAPTFAPRARPDTTAYAVTFYGGDDLAWLPSGARPPQALPRSRFDLSVLPPPQFAAPGYDPTDLAWLPRGTTPQPPVERRISGPFSISQFEALYRAEGMQWVLQGQQPQRNLPHSPQSLFVVDPTGLIPAAFDPAGFPYGTQEVRLQRRLPQILRGQFSIPEDALALPPAPIPAIKETHGDGPRKRGGFAVDQLVVLDLPTATATRHIFRAPTVRIEATQVQEPLPLVEVPPPRATEPLAVFPPPPAPSIVRVPDLRIKRVLDHRAVSYGEALNLVERLVSGEVLTLEQRRTLMRFIRSMRIT